MSGARQATRLIDCCDPLFVFVLHLHQIPDPGAADALRARFNELITQAGNQARGLGASEQAATHLRYACVALVDELVLTSSWPLKDAWLGRPLQMEHFNTFAAGEEFFRLMEAIQTGGDPHRLELLEVFATCIAVGFRGKHGGVAGLEILRGLQRGVIQQLTEAAASGSTQQTVNIAERDLTQGKARRKTDPADLSPSWRPPHEPLLSALPREMPVRLVVVACAAVLLMTFIVLAGVLRHGTSSVIGS